MDIETKYDANTAEGILALCYDAETSARKNKDCTRITFDTDDVTIEIYAYDRDLVKVTAKTMFDALIALGKALTNEHQLPG